MDTLGFMDNLTGDISKAFGNIEKAVLVVVPTPQGDITQQQPVQPAASSGGFFSSLAGAGVSDIAKAAGKAALDGAKNAALNYASSQLGLDTGTDKKGPPNTFLVHFNPASVTFNAVGALPQKVDRIIQPKKEGEVPRRARTSDFLNVNDVNITMGYDLIFQDIDNDDAFLENKLSPINGEAIQSLAKSAVKVAGKNKKNHSVRDEVQALTHIARAKEVNTVIFNWGKTSFKGRINSLKADYTMFSPKGEPIFAKVHIDMVLLSGHGAIDEWDKIYEDAFGQGSGHLKARELGKAGSFADSVSSVANITW